MRWFVLTSALAVALLGATPAMSQVCDEKIEIAPGPGEIDVYHSQAEYNCCAWIDTEVLQLGAEIDIFEREQLEAPCDCLCCFDIIVGVSGLSPGEYVLRIWKNSECIGGDDVLYGTWVVDVEGLSDPSVRTTYIPCVETTAPADVGTWSTIKALFRPASAQ